MNHTRYTGRLIILLLIGSVTISQAQSANSTDEKQFKKRYNKGSDKFEWVDSQRTDLHEVNIIGGYSFRSSDGFWGKIPQAQLSIFTLRYNRKLLVISNDHLLEYVGEISLSANYQIEETKKYQSESFSGFGFSPLGFQFNINQKNIVQPFFKTSAGFMLFNEPFPDQRGVKFNYTLELGGGLEIVVTDHMSLSVGYKYHHMSNGQTGQINPGVDSNIFYTGVTIF